MFRRALSANTATVATATRKYTAYDHIKYPAYKTAAICVTGYFITMWLIFARQGSLLTVRSEYKRDHLRVWRRKLGTGYQWSDAWGGQITTFYKNLPESVE